MRHSVVLSPPAPAEGGSGQSAELPWGCAARDCRATGSSTAHPRRYARDEGSLLCRGCVAQLHRNLRSLPALYDECGEELIPSPVSQIRERITGGRHNALPYNAAAGGARSEIMGLLASWSELVVSERRLTEVPRRTTAALASFLLRHLDWLTGHVAACDLAVEVVEAVKSARNSIQAVACDGFEVGTCVRPGCESPIYVSARAAGSRVLRKVSCSAGHTWEAHEWLLLAQGE
jgi:hypothetical protein